MATQGRRGGSRRKRTDDTAATPPAAAPEIAPVIEPAAAATAPDVELLDDRTVAIAGERRGARFGRSLSGAVLGTLLVAGLAFGAAMGPGGSLGPKSDGPAKGETAAGNGSTAGHEGAAGNDGVGSIDGTQTAAGDGEPGDIPRDGEYWWGDEGGDGDEPDATLKPEQPDGTAKPDRPEPTDKSEPDATKKPEPERTPKPTEKPDPTKEPTEPIFLALASKEDHPVLEWGSCAGLDFDYYKVVRSKDSTVSWPTGEADEVIAVVERGGNRRAYDGGAPHGRKVWYRVFCVRKTEAGYKVVNASATKGIEVPEETPPPDPIHLGLEASVNGEGRVVLSWSACEVDGFAFYKVVKSTWNDNPSYYPWTDGTDVIGVVEGMHDTELHDWAPDAGGTVWYRVQCLGYVDGHKVLLGESAVVAVTTD